MIDMRKKNDEMLDLRWGFMYDEDWQAAIDEAEWLGLVGDCHALRSGDAPGQPELLSEVDSEDWRPC